MELANSIVTLQPGMYILRHPKTGMPPLSISRAAGTTAHNGSIQALYTPSTDGGILRDGRDCIVMQVLNAPVDLLVTAYLEKAGAAVPALKIDKIRLDGDEHAKTPIEVPKDGISLIGHVERTGDVLAKPGEVLGMPETELRVEGFQVMWPDKPEGLDIAYSTRIEERGEGPLTKTGEYSGTRNAAMRVVGVKFVLVGPRADGYSLKGKAWFSGGYEAELQGGESLSGPSGLEHLTGLQLEVQPSSSTNPRRKSGWSGSQKTTIFKRKSATKKA